MPCPNIDMSIEPTSYMRPVYFNGYRFWERVNLDGKCEVVQFCKKIGRKTDVFECLHTEEYRNCRAYRPTDEAEYTDYFTISRE